MEIQRLNQKQQQLDSRQKTTSIHSEKEKQIGRSLLKLNNLLEFPIDILIIMDWSVEINRLKPGLDVSDIDKLIDKFMMGDMEYNKHIGIANIFLGLKLVEKKSDVTFF